MAPSALALLDRTAPPGYLAACSQQAAQARDVGPGEQLSVVIFRIGSEWLALAAAVFLEVAMLRAIHSLPSRRGGLVQGVTNVRGELLVCVSLAKVLGLPVEPGPASTGGRQARAMPRLAVIGIDGQRLGFAVDEMHGMQRFAANKLQPTPSTVAHATATFSKAVLPWTRMELGTGTALSVGLLDEQLLFQTLQQGLN